MDKIKNNGVFYVVISLVAILAISSAVLAYSVTKNITVQGNYYEATQPTDIVQSTDNSLGAVPGPDYYWDYQNFNGLTTYVKTGSFADATTTLACVKNPFGATSTVDLAEVLVTGPSTSTFALNVGSSTASAITGLTTSTVSTHLLMTAPTISADTTGIAVNNYNTNINGFYAAGTVAKIALAPTNYVCFVAGEGAGGSVGGLTGSNNTFKGEYKLRFTR